MLTHIFEWYAEFLESSHIFQSDWNNLLLHNIRLFVLWQNKFIKDLRLNHLLADKLGNLYLACK